MHAGRGTKIGRQRFLLFYIQPYSLLTLANNTCFQYPLHELSDRFNKLYKRKVSQRGEEMGGNGRTGEG